MARSGRSKPLRVVALPDIHVPVHDPKALFPVIRWLATQHIDTLIFAGDFLDMELLGRFVDGKPGAIEGKRLSEDFRIGRELFAEIVKAARTVNRRCRVVLLRGNHESRITNFWSKDPRFAGMFDVPEMLGLEELGVTYVEADTEGDVFRLEWFPNGRVFGCTRKMTDKIERPGLTFTHGWYHGKHSAEKHAACFGHGDIFFGHVHTEQVFTVETYGPVKRRGVTFGTLSRLDLDYVRKAPCTRWVHAFLDLTINQAVPNAYSMQIHRIVDGGVY